MDTEKQELKDALAAIDPIFAATKKSIADQLTIIDAKAVALHKAIDDAVAGAKQKLSADLAALPTAKPTS